MEPNAKSRKRTAVGQLKQLAEEIGVVAVRGRGASDMNKAEFLQAHQVVAASASTPEHRSRAEHALQLYLGDGVALPILPTVPALPHEASQASGGSAPAPSEADGDSDSEEGADKGFRLRSKSCLLTWNSLKFSSVALEWLWSTFLTWLSGLSFIWRWIATAEESLNSKDNGRLHLHAFVEFVTTPDWTSLDKVRFLDTSPNCSPTKARGDNVQTVRDQGHFYCYANKLGTLKVETSQYVPWRDYLVKGHWIDDLWSRHKLSHTVYLEYAANVRLGFVTRCRQVEALREREKASQLVLQREQVARLLAPLQKSFKTSVLQRLKPWADQYQTILPRFKFLVFRGASRTGKSTLARSLGVAMNLGGGPFIQTVQSATAPDLRTYNKDTHNYLVFDNVNDKKFVLDYRAMFQANNDIHTLGDSKTGMYSYDVWLWRVPMVLTIDMSADWDANELWIKDNSFDVVLDGPSWEE